MRGFRRFLEFGVLAGLVALLVFGILHRRGLADDLRLYRYTPPTAIATLADQATMTASARRILYVNHPSIEAKTTFAQHCGNRSEQTIVLGCYVGHQDGIYVLSVTDARLQGVEVVTTAHEMLHAAYDRLSSNQRQNVDAMLTDYYQHDLHDQRILDTIAAYKKSEPNDVVNEMHSVFGTEIANLPAPLEQYYRQYFTNRQQVTQAAARYQAEFTSRQAEVTSDDAQLATMKQQIDQQSAAVQTDQQSLASQRQQLDNLRSNPTAYNAQVSRYNSAVASYNSEIANLKSLIARYNSLVNQRNTTALQVNQLAQSIQGNAVPASGTTSN